MSAPTHDGPSWLTLERYMLGELDTPMQREVERGLAVSARARDMLSAILSDRSELPALPARPRLVRRRAQYLTILPALAAAAALLLWRAPAPSSIAPPAPPPVSKGSAVAISLFSELTGSDPRSFADGERFKLFFTCPPELSAPARVLLFQAGQRYEPLPALAEPACGNQLPWPGAFQLNGAEAVQVCVVWGAVGDQVRSAGQLPPLSACSELRRAH